MQVELSAADRLSAANAIKGRFVRARRVSAFAESIIVITVFSINVELLIVRAAFGAHRKPQTNRPHLRLLACRSARSSITASSTSAGRRRGRRTKAFRVPRQTAKCVVHTFSRPGACCWARSRCSPRPLAGELFRANCGCFNRAAFCWWSCALLAQASKIVLSGEPVLLPPT